MWVMTIFANFKQKLIGINDTPQVGEDITNQGVCLVTC
jgi:hypothetical protein